jgi:neutral ceramidase
MKVGHGSAALPVGDGTPMGGYADRRGGSSGVLHELRVDCVCMRGAAGRFVLVVAEVVCVNDDLASEVRGRVRHALAASGEPVVDVWVCATHTHSGPDVGCVAGGGPTPPQWRRAIGDAAVEAVRVAVASERERSGRLHTGVLRGIGSPRGRREGDHRVSVDVVSCVDAHGALRGVLAVVPVHPTVLPASSMAISGDLAAAIRASLRRRLGAPWVVVATGAAGDISTRHTRRAQTSDECQRLGSEAAEQIAALMRTPPTALWQGDGGALAATRDSVAMPARHQDRADLQAMRERLEEEHARECEGGTKATARIVETALQGVDVAEAGERVGSITLPLSAARLGRLALFGIGAEPFHSFSPQLRDRCAGPSIVLGYTNGHVGYLPDAAAYDMDAAGYEVLSSPLPAEAAAATVASLIELLPNPMED